MIFAAGRVTLNISSEELLVSLFDNKYQKDYEKEASYKKKKLLTKNIPTIFRLEC